MLSKLFRSPLVSVPARYGAIAGLICLGFLISVFYMGKHPFLIYPYYDFRLPVFGVLLFFCLKEIRDYYQGGVLPVWQGMVSCLVFTLVFALLTAMLIWVFCLVQPQFVTSFISGATEQINALPADIVNRIGKDQLDRNLNALPATNGVDLAIDYFGKSFIMSFFISVIISVILRRQP